MALCGYFGVDYFCGDQAEVVGAGRGSNCFEFSAWSVLVLFFAVCFIRRIRIVLSSSLHGSSTAGTARLVRKMCESAHFPLLSFAGGADQWACQVPYPFPPFCGNHVFC